MIVHVVRADGAGSDGCPECRARAIAHEHPPVHDHLVVMPAPAPGQVFPRPVPSVVPFNMPAPRPVQVATPLVAPPHAAAPWAAIPVPPPSGELREVRELLEEVRNLRREVRELHEIIARLRHPGAQGEDR